VKFSTNFYFIYFLLIDSFNCVLGALKFFSRLFLFFYEKKKLNEKSPLTILRRRVAISQFFFADSAVLLIYLGDELKNNFFFRFF
jgi:hypothetical protein